MLVHPGSRVVEQVVRLDDDMSGLSEGEAGAHDVQRLMESAGIRFTVLKPRPSYTVQELELALAVGEPE